MCLSRPSALCQANGVVARFLAESEEVRNKEGFIKIYRRYHPTGKKNRKDEGAKDEDFLMILSSAKLFLLYNYSMLYI